MTRTSTEIRQALADGRAVKRLHVSEEGWYADSIMPDWPRGVVKSWSVGVDSLSAEGRNTGCFGEFILNWYRLPGSHGSLSLRVCAFAEAFPVMTACDGLIKRLFALDEDVTPDEVLGLLTHLGFKDVTERVNPRTVTV